MAKEYKKYYQQFNEVNGVYQAADQKLVYQAFCMGNRSEDGQSAAGVQDAQLYDRLQRTEARLAAIEGSASFKAMIWMKNKLGNRTKALKKIAKKIAAIFHVKIM